MARSSVGAVTITDVLDGFNPLSALLTNQSHTFSANANGDVDNTTKNRFSSTVKAFVGVTEATYNATGGNNTFKILSVTSSNTSWTFARTGATITSNVIPGGLVVSNKDTTVDVVLEIINSVGSATETTLTISLAKAIQGAGGVVVSLAPNRQTFSFNSDGVTADGSITIDVTYAGDAGGCVAAYSKNGGAWTALTQGSGASRASVLDVNGADPADRIVITPANFGDSGSFAIRVTGNNGGMDVISIARIQDGARGQGALSVFINSSSQGFTFKNNVGPNKTLTAIVFDNDTGTTISGASLTYAWKKDGVAIGTDSATIVVSPNDIEFNSPVLYECTVIEA